MLRLLLILLIVSAVLIAVVWRGRARHLARLRAEWGRPVVRTHRMDAIAASYRSRIAGLDAADFLDDRTWDDLNLDDVFAVLDRTESTLGQHALYYRPGPRRPLRTRRLRNAGHASRRGSSLARTRATGAVAAARCARL